MSKLVSKLDLQGYITLSYLGAVGVGMMFDYQYYSRFSIDIFQYADILDFLLVPVKNPEVIAFVLASGLGVFIFFRFDNYWQKKWPKSYKIFNLGLSRERSLKYRPLLILILSIAYLSIAANFYSDRTHEKFKKSGKTIEVLYENGNKVLYGKLIGKNSDYIFLQSADKAVKAIPVASDVQEIVINRP